MIVLLLLLARSNFDQAKIKFKTKLSTFLFDLYIYHHIPLLQ